MNIKPMLARLQSAIGRDDLIEQMVLRPAPKIPISKGAESSKSLTLMVGYNGSPSSHAALDTALLMAHQTRLATSKQVNVQIVYVIDENQSSALKDILKFDSVPEMALEFSSASTSKSGTPVLTPPKLNARTTSDRLTLIESNCRETTRCRNHSFEQADQILWQARCLVEEWRDTCTAHLRVGRVAAELRSVVESEAADLLFLGCHSVSHPIVQQLGSQFPCLVLGIPPAIDD